MGAGLGWANLTLGLRACAFAVLYTKELRFPDRVSCCEAPETLEGGKKGQSQDCSHSVGLLGSSSPGQPLLRPF